MARKMAPSKRAEVPEGDFPEHYKCKKGHVDVIRIISPEFVVYDMHRIRMGGNEFIYANCAGSKKKCALCKAGDEPIERYGLEILHVSRSKRGKKGSKEHIGEIKPWCFAGTIQNLIVDQYDEWGDFTKYNMKLTCHSAQEEQFQQPSVDKSSSNKLKKADIIAIKKARKGGCAVIASVTKPSSEERLGKCAKRLAGEDPDDEDVQIDDEEFDDEDFEDEEFDEALAEIEEEDDDDFDEDED